MKRTTGRPAYLLTSKTRNSTRGAAKTSFLLLAVARSRSTIFGRLAPTFARDRGCSERWRGIFCRS